MKRLRTAIRWDATLQFRNGFYYAAILVAAIWSLLLRQLPADKLAWLLPGAILGNLLINTFYFIGGLLLLEKDEGTLTAQIVTPLRTRDYLAAKLVTLTLLSLLENSLIALITYGWAFRFLPFALGLTLASVIFALAGFLAVIRYDAINEYLLPSMLYGGGLTLPLIAYFGGWQHWLVYLHPLQAPLLLLQAGWSTIAIWQWIYALLYAALWAAVAYILSQRAFHHFVVTGSGVH
ncbi:MAG: hypothetical protein KC413_16800 [Anaerolineales bacterium]|nr:hypothetical protein [Anaerolineales bacterium]